MVALNDLDLILLNNKYKEGILDIFSLFYNGLNDFTFLGIKNVNEQIDAGYANKINFPNLLSCECIGTSQEYCKEANLPNLQIGKNFYLSGCEKVNLSMLEKVESLYAYNAKEIILPVLKEYNHKLECQSVEKLNLPKLENSGWILADKAEIINAPNLINCEGSIRAYRAKELNLPKIEKFIELSCDLLIKLDLPNLKYCSRIMVTDTEEINLPLLEVCISISCPSARKIIIQKHLLNKLKDVPNDCEIIHPEEIKTESFKLFFNKR